MVYQVRGNRKKGFSVADANGNIHGRIDYSNWFSRRAVISLDTHDNCEIVPSGFWQTSFDIIKAEYKVGEIRMNWRGNMKITLLGKSYLLKRSGLLQRSRVLMWGTEELAFIKQSYDWAKMGYVYDITLKNHDIITPDIYVMLLLTVYCTNQQYAGSGVS